MDDIKNTIAGVAKNIKKTSGNIIKTTKINMAVSSEEANIKSVYEEIGRKVHEIYTYGGSLGKFFDEKYAEILESEKKISLLKSELELAKGSVTCPNCSLFVSKDNEYCPKCGSPMFPGVKKHTERKVAGTAYNEQSNNAAPQNTVPRDVVPQNTAPYNVTPQNVTASESKKKKCGVCGELNDEDDKFCLSCGRYL